MPPVIQTTPEGNFLYAYEEMHDLGIGPESPATWGEYASITPSFRQVLETFYTPSAYKALHYNPNTFKRIYELPGMQHFEELEIFKLEKNNNEFIPLTSTSSRSPYAIIFAAARQMIRVNHRNILRNLIERRTDDVSPFVNMGFVCESRRCCNIPGEEEEKKGGVILLAGFFPYFSNSSVALGETMFFFSCARTNRLALVTAPNEERQRATDFIRAHGVMHLFDRICAYCGIAASDLYKCPCKAVRYCSTDCHHAHWPRHKVACTSRSSGGGERREDAAVAASAASQ